MIHRATRQYDKDHVLSQLDPTIREWFDGKFKDLTPPQSYAVPLIHDKKNVLIASPTGSGKTLTAFLTIINELFTLGRTQKLENKIYCLYISPLKALANDIERNLNRPLDEIYKLAEEKGIPLPEIRVGVRSGDTSAYEKQKMVRTAPHILITTPETLAIVLSTTRFKDNLRDVRYVIVDEIHEVCNSKRGVHLSVSLERLQHLVSSRPEAEIGQDAGVADDSKDAVDASRTFTRIGLSATQAPIKEIAKFLVGYNGNRLRDVHIIEALFGKQLDLKVLCPVQDMNLVPFEIVNAKMYQKLKEMIDAHRTTLVFTNTRSGTEAVVFKLKERGIDNIAAHHGSLSKEIRLDVEQKLKNGELDATITSTSLELGIDIGYIDLVCQIGSPKSIAKGLQRIGRAGHALHEVSKGRIIVFDRDDLVECSVLVRSAYSGNLDRVSIPTNSLDVLAQVLIGMSLEQRWHENEAYRVVRNSYSFHNLSKQEFRSVLAFIGGRHSLEETGVYGKIWYDPGERSFGIRRGSRLIYNLNLGTIPQESSYKVTLFGAGMHLGSLSEKFVERLSKGDVFILGGKTYEFIQCKGMRVFVKDAHGRKPTVPSWTGEMLPRSFDLSMAIGKFRRELAEKLEQAGEDTDDVENWLAESCFIDEGSARSIVNYVKEQLGINPDLPTDKNVVVEGYIDARGYKNLVFHYCFGRRVNDALSRAYAYALSSRYKCTVKISLTDDNFMLSLPKRVELSGLHKLVTTTTLAELLKASVRHTELFKQRFRHCAVRSFMILRNYKGKDISIKKQHYRAQRVLEMLGDDLKMTAEPGTGKTVRKKAGGSELPVISETFNEILNDAMDIDNAMTVLKDMEEGKITMTYVPYSNIPSPFAHNVVLMGISDIVLMEDRSALLRELHKQVLSKVVSKDELAQSKFELPLVEAYFAAKIPKVKNKEDVLRLLNTAGPMRLFVEKGRNIFNYSSIDRRRLIKWCRELANDGEITSFIRNDVIWLPAQELPVYYSVYQKPLRLGKGQKELLDMISSSRLPDKLDRKMQDDLRKLEKLFIVHRNRVESYGVHHFGIRDMDKLKNSAPPFDEALDKLISGYLEYHGVSTVAEVSYELDLDEELTQKMLRELEDRNIVSSGNFVMGKDLPQFMLLKDMLKLELAAAAASDADAEGKDGSGELVMDEADYLKFVENREFAPVAGIHDYFDRYLISGSVRDIFVRVPDFDLGDWHQLLADGDVVQGRFLGGRVCYIRRSEVEPSVNIYRRAELNQIDASILDYIRTRVERQYQTFVNNSENSNAPHSRIGVKSGLAAGPSLGENGEISTAETVNNSNNSIYEEYHNNKAAVQMDEGVTKSELLSALKYRETDVVDSIEKLDHNLYIARSKRDTREHGIVNRYITLDEAGSLESAPLELLKRLVEGYGPMPVPLLKNLTRLSGEFLKDTLDVLERDGEIFKFVVVGESLMEVYASSSQRTELEHFNNEQKNKHMEDRVLDAGPLRILSQTDPFTRRFDFTLKNKFGDEWHSAIFEGTVPRGVIQLWKLASCVEIRDITFDPDLSEQERLRILDVVLQELDRLMGYYEMAGLDIIKINFIEEVQALELPSQVKNVLKNHGYDPVQDFYVKGKLLPLTFSKAEIINYVFYQQHIHPTIRFDDPMEILEKFGGLRSNFEMHLRLKGRAYDLKEYRRHHDLAAGQMIPEFFMYCTYEDAQLYKSAKGQEPDDIMKYILDHVDSHNPIKAQELQDRVNLSESSFKAAVKKLQDGLFLIKSSLNHYQRVDDMPNVSRAKARKMVVMRILENFGIFTPEKLAAYLKRGFSMEEIRTLLRELEREGALVKGYLVEGDPDLYYIVRGMEKRIRKLPKLRERFVLSNQDLLNHYLAAEIRDKFGIGSCFVIFDGTEMTGAFKATKRGNRLIVSEFIGSDEDWSTARMFTQEHRLDLIEKDQQDLYDYDES